MTLHPSARRVEAALQSLGAETQITTFPEGARTAQDAATAIGTTVARIVKSLVFLAGGKPVLVLASGANRVDTDKLAALLEQDIERPDARAVKELTGFSIGGVPPVGHAAPLAVVIDQDLLEHAEIYAAAGTPHTVFRTHPDDLRRITGGQVADIAATG